MPDMSMCHIDQSVYKDEENSVYKDDSIYIDEEESACEIKVEKSVPDRQIVFGWASIAMMKDGSVPLDWQDDIIPVDEIETMAYDYVEFYGQTGVQHSGNALGHVIESMAFTPDKMDALGIPQGTVHYGWWIGFHIPDIEIYNKVKSGELKQFSIQGKAKRVSALPSAVGVL